MCCAKDLVAFASVFLQAPGLYGPNGLEPVEKIVARVANNPSGMRADTLTAINITHRYRHTQSSYRSRVCSGPVAPSTGSHRAGKVARPHHRRRDVGLTTCDVWLPSLHAAARRVLALIPPNPPGWPDISLFPMGHLLARGWRAGLAVRACLVPIIATRALCCWNIVLELVPLQDHDHVGGCQSASALPDVDGAHGTSLSLRHSMYPYAAELVRSSTAPLHPEALRHGDSPD